MNLVMPNGSTLSISTPNDVLLWRDHMMGQDGPNYDGHVDQATTKKLAKLVRIKGLTYYHHALRMASAASASLDEAYNFKTGITLLVSRIQIPDFALNDTDLQRELINYAADILIIFGWSVEVREERAQFYLKFAPQKVLTPEDISAEIDKRVTSLAMQAVSIIQNGLLLRQKTFYRKELGLTPGQVHIGDYYPVVHKIQEILGPEWSLESVTAESFIVIPTPS